MFRKTAPKLVQLAAQTTIQHAAPLSYLTSSTLCKANSSLRLPDYMRRRAPLLQTPKSGIQLAVLDWSGTVADSWVIAPAYAFVKVFEKHGVNISMAQAREPMGLRKDLHIQKLLLQEDVREIWFKAKGSYPNSDLQDKNSDAAKLFKDFMPIQKDCIREYGALIPGTVATTELLRKNGIKIGSTTGFFREQVDILLEEAVKQGAKFDCTVSGDEVINGDRPKPFMVYRNMDLVGVSNPSLVVKVDDTVGGVGEGLNAGCWAVGVSDYSNYMNINSMKEAEELGADEMQRRREASKAILEKSGAHYVIPSIEKLPEVIADINYRLSKGETPTNQQTPKDTVTIEEKKEAAPRRFGM